MIIKECLFAGFYYSIWIVMWFIFAISFITGVGYISQYM